MSTGKKSQLEKAIASIDADIQVLEAAKKRLQLLQIQQTVRKPRAVKKPEAVA